MLSPAVQVPTALRSDLLLELAAQGDRKNKWNLHELDGGTGRWKVENDCW